MSDKPKILNGGKKETLTIEYPYGEKGKERVYIETVYQTLDEKFMRTKMIQVTGDPINNKGGLRPNDITGFGSEEFVQEILNSEARDIAIRKKLDEIYANGGEGQKFIDDNDLFRYTSNGGAAPISELGFYKENNNSTNTEDTNDEGGETTQAYNPAAIYAAGPFSADDNMVYPTDLLHVTGQDYMYFEQFTYKAPQPLLVDSIGKSPKEALTTGLGRGTNIDERKGTCILPIPSRLAVSDGVNWGEGRANALEAAAFGAATRNIGGVLSGDKSLAALFKDASSEAAGAFRTLRDQMKNIDGNASAATVLNSVLARGILGSIGINVDLDQFLVRQTGQAINPNLELLFGGPKLRSFSFEFNFAPNSAKEAVTVRKIQRWFRQGMLAQKMSDTATALFLGSPHVFKLSYRNSGRRIRGLNTFKICALTSAQINFTPDGVYQSYEDEAARSMPVRSTMGLTFSELTPIFFNDYLFVDENGEDGVKNENPTLDTSLLDVKEQISGDNAFTKDDLGF